MINIQTFDHFFSRSRYWAKFHCVGKYNPELGRGGDQVEREDTGINIIRINESFDV